MQKSLSHYWQSFLNFYFGTARCLDGKRIGQHDGYGTHVADVHGILGNCQGCTARYWEAIRKERIKSADRAKEQRIQEMRAAFRLALADEKVVG